MLEASLVEKIKASVDAGFAEQIAYTQDLVRFASTRGAEHAIQDFVFQTFRSRGLTMERFEMDREALERHPGAGKFSQTHSTAPIVVGIHRPRSETGHSLILQAHVRRTCGRIRRSIP
jgi:acetylornithine deacetylase